MKAKFLCLATMLLMSLNMFAQTLSVPSVEAEAGTNTTLEVNISGATAKTALQFNLSLPEGVTLNESEITNGNAASGHTLSVNTLDSGDYLFILYSMDLSEFSDGTLLNLPITAGSTTGTFNGSLSMVRFADTEAVSQEGEDAQFDITVSDQPVFSNEKLYTLTSRRGAMVLNTDATRLAAGQIRTDATEADMRFAIITYNDARYLYSPVNKQFLLNDGSFTSHLGTPITFDNDNADGEYRYMMFTLNATNDTIYFNNNNKSVVIDSWDTPDSGNRWKIEAVADFDPSEALALAALKTCKVTYEVSFDGQVVETSSLEVVSGNDMPEVPSSLTNSYVTLTATGTHPTTVSDDVTVSYDAVWSGPFQFTKTLEDAKWYNMHIRNGYYVGKQTTEPYVPAKVDAATLATPNYLWAFGGNPYHVKVYNYSTGLEETLAKDGSNAVMRSGDYSWDLLPNSDGFVLRAAGTQKTCINQVGGTSGPLQFWVSDYSLTDEGSTFRVEYVDVLTSIHSLNGNAGSATVQLEQSVLTVTGAPAGTPISVYDAAGRLINSTTSTESTTRLKVVTNEKVVIVKVGDQSLKVVI